MGELIEFPKKGGAAPRGDTHPIRRDIFVFDSEGRIDLAPGVNVSDAVTQIWQGLSEVVARAWDEGPYSDMRARERLLVALLDRVRPNWRKEIAWEDSDV